MCERFITNEYQLLLAVTQTLIFCEYGIIMNKPSKLAVWVLANINVVCNLQSP